MRRRNAESIALLIVALTILLTAAFWIWAAETIFAEDYMVIGHGPSGEQVLGVLEVCHSDTYPYDTACRNDTVRGVVYDQHMRLEVTGRMCGKGQFCVGSGPRQYVLEVVE